MFKFPEIYTDCTIIVYLKILSLLKFTIHEKFEGYSHDNIQLIIIIILF